MRWTFPGLLSLLLCGALFCGCPDFSALQEASPPYGHSPSLDSLLDARPDPSDPEEDVLLPDLDFPQLDISIEGLEGLALLAVEPKSGDIAGQELVMLVGAGFHDSMEVFFGQAKAAKPFVVNDHYATVETPPQWPGVVDVRIVAQDGTVAVMPDAYTYTSALLVESVEPASGPTAGGTPVEVSGAGFDASCTVFFGGRKALVSALLDPFHIQTVSPPGNCSKAHVHVVCDAGNGLLKEGFHYQGLPVLQGVLPAVAPAAGGVWVDLMGSSFTPDMTVTINGDELPWYDVVFLAANHVRAKLPEGVPGPVEVILNTACGAALFADQLLYAKAAEEPVLTGVVPGHVPACEGGFLTVALASLGDPSLLTVEADGQPLDVLSYDEDLGSVDVALPPGEPGPVAITATVDLQPAEGLFEVQRLPGPAVFSVTPGSGHVGGGTEVAIEGCGFPSDVEVRFGPQVATDIQPFSDSTIGATVPPGSPGPVTVQVASSQGVSSLTAGFTYLTDDPSLYLVSPAVGAMGGGTYVRFFGAGMPPNASLRIGEKACFDLYHVDGTLITARVPANEVGTYDVHLDWPGGSVTLAKAFTYFNPSGNKSGTWGGPIDEAVNVTVLDGSNGDGLAAAYVMMGHELQSPHQGYTDENGQVTFSAPGLKGPVVVTAAKPGFSLYSVVHYDAANVTVYLTPIVLPSSGGSTYTPMQSYVAGRVFGLDKYAVVPPGNCSKKSVEGPLCLACQTDVDCVVDGLELEARCVDIGDTGRYCVTQCAQNADCPADFSCAKVAFDFNGCWPKGGERSIRCQSSKGSMFGSPPDPGPGGVTNSHDIYFINAVTGEMAVVCYGGYTDPDTYQFVPTVMGLKRHIIVLNGDIKQDQDITLNIPLTRTARVSFHDLPYHPEGIRKPYLLFSLELGKEGYLDPPVKPEWVEGGAYYRIPALPAQMTGPLLGTTYSMYASVQSETPFSMPYAVRMVTEVEHLFGDGIMWVKGDEVEAISAPVAGDIVGLSYRADNDIYVATGLGELVHFDGVAWTPAGLPFTKQGFTTMVEDGNGHLWVGGLKGDLWHFNGVAWTWIDTGIDQPVRDLWAGGGKAVALYSWMAAVVGDFGLEESHYAPSGSQLKRVWGADFQDLYVVSTGYNGDVLWNVTPGNWDPLAMAGKDAYTDLDGASPDAVWVLSSPGKVLKFEGSTFEEFPLAPYEQLKTVVATAEGRVLVGAADGQLWSLLEGQFVAQDTGSLQDLLVVAPSQSGGGVLAAGAQSYNMGPFMAYPRIIKPAEGEMFDFSQLQWDYWTQGATADVHSIILSSDAGFPFWSMVVDGEVTNVQLPPIVKALGLNVIPDGPKRWNLTSTLNPEFNIDYYSSSDFSIYRRISWAVDYVKFQ